tara:strand:+ start:898 stop:1074 length:177 start_codon:yes stop_codon:yes gene_type:complete
VKIELEKKMPSDSNVSEQERLEKYGRGSNQFSSKEKYKNSVDPTRYGDWEKNGRCIDF